MEHPIDRSSYGARLPDKSSVLCKKLGGPQDPSPKRPTGAISTNSSVNARPGSAIIRQPLCKPRKTLERVLTDDKPSHKRQKPSLSRSATEPSLPQMKREASETSLSSIPLNRVGLSKRYSQREVDLRAASQHTEAKLKKKANIEQQLHGAIAALKKPNPRMAVKELIEDAEKRAAIPRSRKAKNPVRNLFAQSMQVMATPSKDRKRDFTGLPRLPRQPMISHTEVEEIPPSSVSKVSCSATKAGTSSVLRQSSIQKPSASLSHVEQTPTKGPSKFFVRSTSFCDMQSPRPSASRSSFQAMVEEAPPIHLFPPQPSPRMVAVHSTPTRKEKSVSQSSPRRAESLGIDMTPVKSWKSSIAENLASQGLHPAQEATAEQAAYDNDGDDVDLL